MESRTKRVSQAVGPVEVPTPSVVPSGMSGEASAKTAAAPVAPVPGPAPAVDVPAPPIPSEIPELGAAREEAADFGREASSVLAQSRRALAAGFDALSEEMAGLARCNIDTAAHAAIEMLAVRTVSDAIAVNAGFARASFDNWIGRSAKFSELGAKLAADSSRLVLERLGNGWIGIGRI